MMCEQIIHDNHGVMIVAAPGSQVIIVLGELKKEGEYIELMRWNEPIQRHLQPEVA